MKNTKNLLITGIVLATALFTSVQVTAMKKPVNPYLTPSQIKKITSNIVERNMLISGCDPKTNLGEYSKQFCHENAQKLKKLKAIYHGNRTYTDDEIQASL